MYRTEKVQKIREGLKKLGYSSRQVSVTSSICGYSSAIDIKVKDMTVNMAKVKEICSGFDDVRRDEYSGEILEGGNTYVSVEYYWKTIEEAAQKKLSAATEFYNRSNADLMQSNYQIATYGVYELVYLRNENEARIQKRPEDFETRTCYCLDTIKRYTAHNAYALAEAMVYFDAFILSLK